MLRFLGALAALCLGLVACGSSSVTPPVTMPAGAGLSASPVAAATIELPVTPTPTPSPTPTPTPVATPAPEPTIDLAGLVVSNGGVLRVTPAKTGRLAFTSGSTFHNPRKDAAAVVTVQYVDETGKAVQPLNRDSGRIVMPGYRLNEAFPKGAAGTSVRPVVESVTWLRTGPWEPVTYRSYDKACVDRGDLLVSCRWTNPNDVAVRVRPRILLARTIDAEVHVLDVTDPGKEQTIPARSSKVITYDKSIGRVAQKWFGRGASYSFYPDLEFTPDQPGMSPAP